MTTRTYQFEIEGPIPAQDVLNAMVDFSDKRLTYYPNLQRSKYEVLELNDTSARVREGAGGFLSQERYDWATPGQIRSVIEESNFAAPGSSSDVKIVEKAGGGFYMRVTVNRDYVGFKGNLLRTLLAFNGGKRAMRRTYKKMLNNVRTDLYTHQRPAKKV